jgi:hypothetical protein
MEVRGQLHTAVTLQATHMIMGLTQNDDEEELTFAKCGYDVDRNAQM